MSTLSSSKTWLMRTLTFDSKVISRENLMSFLLTWENSGGASNCSVTIVLSCTPLYTFFLVTRMSRISTCKMRFFGTCCSQSYEASSPPLIFMRYFCISFSFRFRDSSLVVLVAWLAPNSFATSEPASSLPNRSLRS